MAHAEFSPSSAHRWIPCPGSIKASRGLPDTSGGDAREGTDAHHLGELLLKSHPDTVAAHYIGKGMPNGTVVDADFARYVQMYVDYVQQIVAANPGAVLLVEQVLPIDHLTGERGAVGTADAVILTSTEIVLCDLKFGRGVQVFAEENPQLMMYALGALRMFGMAADFQTARLVIIQPRLGHFDEWTVPVGDVQ